MTYELLERLASHLQTANEARAELATAIADLTETAEEVAGDEIHTQLRLSAALSLAARPLNDLARILASVGKAADDEFSDYYDAVEEARIASDIEDAQRDGSDLIIAKHFAAALDRIMS